MNFRSNNNPKFKVYMHISPDNKRYIGITSQTLHARWGYNGRGYIDNKHFFAAIQLHGWDNFEHVIVAEDLDLLAASELECQLISKYNTTDSNCGYNHTSGGNWSTPSDEVREKLRTSLLNVWKNDEYRQRMCKIQQALPHRPLTELHKQHISASLKGRISPLRGIKFSEERKAALRGRIPWNKGETKHTHPSVAKTSIALKDRQFSDDTKVLMSNSRKSLYANGYKPTLINNGKQEKQIDKSSDHKLPEGYVYGRLPTVYVTNGKDTRKIHPDLLAEYESQGWVQGKSDSTNEAVKRSHQQFIWTYENLEFSSAKALATYLQNNGYPDIVDSTINILYRTQCSKSGKYTDLISKIARRPIDENS